MSQYYPQSAVILRIIWEDFGSNDPLLKQAYTLQALAKKVRVSVNDYTKADTFEIELDYKNFPFDPRTIRSAQVSVHIEDMKALYESGKPIKIVPKIPSSSDGDHNTVVLGFVDDVDVSLTEQKIVTLKGRDFTSLFIDSPFNGKVVALDKPVDKVIEELISRLKTTGDIKVVNRTGVAALPTLAKLAPDLGDLSGKRNGRKKENYWDVIQQICQVSALICYIELDKLVITLPKVLYDPKKGVQFFYGKNLSSLEFSRKVGRMKGFNILVKSVKGKEVITAKIPLESTGLDIGGKELMVQKQGTKGEVVEEPAPYMVFPLSNITSKEALIEYGERVFEEVGRQQIEGKFKTVDMNAFDGNRTKIDITKLRNGAPVSIEIDHQDAQALNRTSSVAQKISYLKGRGYSNSVASALAQTGGKFSTPFYVREVSMSLDGENGFSVDVDFVNRIETAGKGF